ncbi:MAG TPA: S-methyl-5'-thioadenosine phosphorylase [bacterium]|nr:S-methyl-5'-thioadenosine phosphorylase [bacterium]
MGAPRIGIIGGSGLYEMPGFTVAERKTLSTPFGDPSDEYVVGSLGGTDVVFLPRHGRGHRIMPSELNFRANLFGFKLLGVERVISVSAVGSMKEGIAPGHIVIPDQFFDRTHGRPSTFFGGGLVVHVGFADPVCTDLCRILARAAGEEGAKVHDRGVYLCIEGPQFSTRAESRIFRQWGVDVIGMTNLPEARLAREAELCYSTLALVTDYDCWHEGSKDVTVEIVIETLNRNVLQAQKIVRRAVGLIPADRTCGCAHALKDAIITARDKIPATARLELAPLLDKYLTN